MTTVEGASVTQEVLRRAESVVSKLHKSNRASPELTNTAGGEETKRGGATKDSQDSQSRCLVYCRLRPSNKKDQQDGSGTLITIADPRRVVVKDERHYDFDGTFDSDCTQDDVFQTVAVPCIQHAFQGFCSALMCYGQTGTGKSFTMCNTDPANEGVIPRASRYIFDTIASMDPSRTYTVIGQMVQIYRDHLGDLMSSDGKERVEIHYDARDGVSLTGCSSHTLTDANAFMQFYKEGNKRRVVTATAMNPESSRGHTAMVIWIMSENPDDPMTGRMKGKITFIDLAGYERFSKTGITDLNPIMKDEAKTINASLLALGHVVSSLSSGSKHIPWRNAKLTRILQDSIGGRSRTSIILTVGPSSAHLYESTNTLQFGLRAMAVKVEAKVSVTVNYEKLAQKLMGLLGERDARINVLELQIASRDAERQELLSRYQQDRDALEERFANDLENLTASGASEEQIRKLKEVYNVEVQNLQDQQSEELSYQDEINSREIAKIINEQKHEEAKSLTAMRLAQDNIVESFQRKLELARGGTNDDLLKALRQLSEKDAVMASRANDTARLHSHITALTQQLRALGADPEDLEDFPESFLDVAQVEEIQRRLNEEVSRLQDRVADLQTQLDRMTLLCNDRSDEVGRLVEDNKHLREQLVEAGAKADSPTMEMHRWATHAERNDQSELETQRLRMQSEIDDVARQRDTATAELQRLKDTIVANARRMHSSRSLNATTRDLTLSCVLKSDDMMLLGSDEDTNGGGGSSVKRLTQQLASSVKENENMASTIRTLETVLQKNGIAIPDQTSPAVANGDSKTSRTSGIELLLSVKDDEVSALEELTQRQETKLTQAQAAIESRQQVIDALRAQVHELGATPQEPEVPSLQPVEGVPLEDYTQLLRKLRQSNRQVSLKLLEGRDAADPHALSVEGLLEDRDNQLELKDELLLEKSAMAQYMVKLSGRLISQMETLGLTPCCTLPSTFDELLKADSSQLGIQTETQMELERKLEAEAEEKQRMNRLLSALNAEREHQALVLQQTEAKNKELAAREDQATRAMFLLAEEKTENEAILSAAAYRANHELMEMQARLAEQQAKRKTGVFERFFGKLLD